uniref:NADH-ubiquinone oxidoreductase chain 5 n=1 Tax=Neogymnocrinus richeri TaxID=710152 RepID=Q2QJE6_9ECHI|nr:NADH dehydrogenase subunit 5 [Neogymnocrinus richeri]AAY51820.1 NADH dehydrogenase subunit 5 [Neogymnocrinus richeri]
MNLIFLLSSVGFVIFLFLLMNVFSASSLFFRLWSFDSFFGLYVLGGRIFHGFEYLSVSSLKLLSFFSFVVFYFYLSIGCPLIKVEFSDWFSGYGFLGSLCFTLDFYSVCFFFVGSYVTWSIIQFSCYYMGNDLRSSSFFRLLLVFLFNMLVLVSSDNLFLIFIGWEGVGFLSFLLIGWWGTRVDANSSALEAVIYNRAGDIGFLLFFSLCLSHLNTWSLSGISSLYEGVDDFLIFGLLFSGLLAAMAKSAQLGFHPWLPAAMEGPTPVSALLHSSTMVVAGVFLLIRLGDIINFPYFFCSACLFVGGITSFFAAGAALVQHDIKKVVAYSTTSQLGLMVVSIGLGNFVVAFFHICTHAFFKAMLFLCSGSIIHSLNDEQDLRKMGGLFYFLPVTGFCITLGSLALVGTPFLAGFYSKDVILELCLVSISNFLGVGFAFISSLFTVMYSFRVIIFCFLFPYLGNTLFFISEEDGNLVLPIIRLALGTILSGWFFCGYVFPSLILVLPTFLKITTFFMVLFGVLLGFVVYLGYSYFGYLKNFYWFLSGQWFFLLFFHIMFSSFYFFVSIVQSTRLLDRGWSESVGPGGSGVFFTTTSSASQSFYLGYVKYYILASLLVSLLLVALIVFV